MEMAVGIFVQFCFNWVSLVFSGRIFDRLSSDVESSWRDDALASLMIVIIVNALFVFSLFVPIVPRPLVFLVYFVLIYYAFQLDGFMDAVSFYFIHVMVNAVLFFATSFVFKGLPILEG